VREKIIKSMKTHVWSNDGCKQNYLSSYGDDLCPKIRPESFKNLIMQLCNENNTDDYFEFKT
jgi:hypothetical protein